MAGTSRFYASPDGLDLHLRSYGTGAGGLPVVCLPGLTRNARDFEGLATYLSDQAGHPVHAFDYRGRGLSAHDREWRNYNLATETGDVLAGLAEIGVERAAFIGTSRGGLITHLLAAVRPQVLAGVVLNDVGPELGAEGLRHIVDYLGEKRPAAQSFEEFKERQRGVHGTAFPALSDAEWTRFAQALVKADGVTPDFDPALLRTLEGIDWTSPLPDLWEQFESFDGIPLMVVRGENSRLLTEDTLHEMARRHPGTVVETVHGQGHAPLLDTGALPERIAAFLRALV
ncbi:MAG: alpha/beta hydrolase [Mesorhizobium amorphae]|nr:MAG: alpha/beta hydrolase [Mesorhizobium amorphae]